MVKKLCQLYRELQTGKKEKSPHADHSDEWLVASWQRYGERQRIVDRLLYDRPRVRVGGGRTEGRRPRPYQVDLDAAFRWA